MEKFIRFLLFFVCGIIIVKDILYKDVTAIFPTEKERSETKYIIIHHTATCEQFTIGEVDDYHTKKGWGSGFGYNLYICNHVVYKVKDIDSPTANALNHNYDAVAICVQGDFDKETPDYLTLAELRITIQILKICYPDAKLVTHGEVNATKCCGENLKNEIQKWK